MVPSLLARTDGMRDMLLDREVVWRVPSSSRVADRQADAVEASHASGAPDRGGMPQVGARAGRRAARRDGVVCDPLRAHSSGTAVTVGQQNWWHRGLVCEAMARARPPGSRGMAVQRVSRQKGDEDD